MMLITHSLHQPSVTEMRYLKSLNPSIVEFVCVMCVVTADVVHVHNEHIASANHHTASIAQPPSLCLPASVTERTAVTQTVSLK